MVGPPEACAVLPDQTGPEPVDESQPSPEGKVLPLVPRERPDWLVRPGDDVMAAADSASETRLPPAGAGPPRPVLSRPAPAAHGKEPGQILPLEPHLPPGRRGDAGAGPGADATADAAGDEPVRRRPRREAPARPVPRDPDAPPVAWTAAASSIPVLRLPFDAEPEPEEPGPRVAKPARPPDIPGADEDRLVQAVAGPELKPLVEPWWVIALDALRTNRKVQAGVGAGIVCVALLVWWMWPRGVGTTLLSEVRRNASYYDGRAVVVRGRVGDDVFAVGSGWAYYLVQGRDTIVTFTRAGAPVPRKVVTVTGHVSTGFLDGVPRQALFQAWSAPD